MGAIFAAYGRKCSLGLKKRGAVECVSIENGESGTLEVGMDKGKEA